MTMNILSGMTKEEYREFGRDARIISNLDKVSLQEFLSSNSAVMEMMSDKVKAPLINQILQILLYADPESRQRVANEFAGNFIATKELRHLLFVLLNLPSNTLQLWAECLGELSTTS